MSFSRISAAASIAIATSLCAAQVALISAHRSVTTEAGTFTDDTLNSWTRESNYNSGTARITQISTIARDLFDCSYSEGSQFGHPASGQFSVTFTVTAPTDVHFSGNGTANLMGAPVGRLSIVPASTLGFNTIFIPRSGVVTTYDRHVTIVPGQHTLNINTDIGSATSSGVSSGTIHLQVTFAPGFCPSDFNHDSAVDFFDYLDFVDAYSRGNASANFNSDAAIDFFDYLDFVEAFSSGC